ncbi:phage protein NinX family protein [Morganella morganii]
MNKYRDNPDHDINKAVAIAHGYKVMSCEESVMAYIDSGYKPFDPCNNPADAMLIIIENKICMAYDVFAEERDGGSWVAQPAYGFSDERVRSDNYYRAAMICFLMMKDAENEK